MALSRRLQKELQTIQTDKDLASCNISVSVKDNNPRYLAVTIAGPQGSPYEGGLFRLELFCQSAYPMEPPKIRFLTKLYHPNIDRVGRICLNILKETGWSPALQISAVLLSVQQLLGDPNLEDPLDTTICDHFKSDRAGAVAKAKQMTREFAK